MVEIGRRQIVGIAGAGESRLGLGDSRLRMEIVQAEESAHHAGQGLRHGGIGGIGEMGLAVHLKDVHRGVQRARNLAGVPTKGDPVAPPRLVLNREPGALEPCRHFVGVARAQPEPVAELFGGEPLTIARRGGILLVRQ